MRTFARGQLLVLPLLAAAAIAAYWLATRDTAPALLPQRLPAPAFTLTTLDGKPLELQALHGKVVLVDFWATWCGPCRDEAPKLIELQQKYAGRGVQVVGISMDDDAAPVRTFYQQHHISYPVALGDAALGERFGGVLGMPAKFLIDRQGRIAAKHHGAVDFTQLERELNALIAE